MSTSWLGGDTGLISLGSGQASLWYTKVVGEIPRAISGSGRPPYTTEGYHLIGQLHKVNHIPLTGSLKVYVDGVEVAVSITLSDRFTLDDDRNGWIRVEYLPSSAFVGRNNLTRTNFAHALAPLLKIHLTNLMVAINDAEMDLNLEATLWQVGRLGSLSDTAEVTSFSVLDKGLFSQIMIAINYLRRVLRYTHQKSISGLDMSAPSDIIDPAFIDDARTQVNNIEAAIVTI